MTTYNLTGLDNSSGLLPIVTTIDQNSGGWFGGAMLMFLFLILLLTFRKNGNQDAFLASSALTSLLAGLGFGFGLLSGYTLIFPVTMLIISIVMKIWGEG